MEKCIVVFASIYGSTLNSQDWWKYAYCRKTAANEGF